MKSKMWLLILGIVLILVITVLSIGWSISAPGYKGSTSAHFDGTVFRNLSGTEAKGLGSLLKWIVRRDSGPWEKDYETTVGEKPKSASEELLITFVNHSTFLIQWGEINVLTDPIWSERCSPFSFAGPQRMRPPGIHYDDLPSIDIVILSHNHYDHLDISTIIKLENKFHPLFIVPLGVKDYLANKGIGNCIELDWWQETDAGLNIKSVPAQHFSGRGMFDRDKTLWSGYIVSYEGKKLYFVGDTGYGKFFKEIGEKEGPIDVSLIPIGAYMPGWFMSPIHISPLEAVQVHKDIKSKQSIAMHFGTFPLADEGQGKAEEDLILALQQKNISQQAFIIPEEGIPMSFK